MRILDALVKGIERASRYDNVHFLLLQCSLQRGFGSEAVVLIRTGRDENSLRMRRCG